MFILIGSQQVDPIANLFLTIFSAIPPYPSCPYPKINMQASFTVRDTVLNHKLFEHIDAISFRPIDDPNR